MALIPMSQIDSILGLPGLAVQRVDRKLGIHVWSKPTSRPPCVHCTSGSVRIKATHSRTLKHTRQGNQIMILHLSIPKYHCLSCNRYFRHQFPWARLRLRATESYRLEVFEAHDGGVSQSKLALTHRIGSATIERWYQHLIKRRVSELSGRSEPSLTSGTYPKSTAIILQSIWSHSQFSRLCTLPNNDSINHYVLRT